MLHRTALTRTAAALAVLALLVLAGCFNEVRDTPAPSSAESVPSGQSLNGASGVLSDTKAPPEAIPSVEPDPPKVVPDELKLVWEVWERLNEEHVDRGDFNSDEFAEGAIRGMIDVIDDRNTSYVRPEAFQIQRSDIEGKFEGIGAHVTMRRDGILIIMSPIPGGPAEAMGLKPGDAVLAVDGVSIEGLSLLEAVSRIRGPKGSEVVLTIKHLTAIDPIDITLTRDVIPLVSVLLRSEPGDRIAHIRLTEFYGNTAGTLEETLQEAVDAGAKGLILDVRDNPGGLLSSVIDVVSQFVNDGLILYQVDANGERTAMETKGGEITDIPMVVLTNEYSASASEILAGALKDHGRATIVGATTFGKGSVNHLRRLSNGGGLWITIKRWLTPSGNLIHGSGVEPDVEVVNRDRQTAEVNQLEKAREVLDGLIDAREAQTSG